jgi:hypothetical protein
MHSLLLHLLARERQQHVLAGATSGRGWRATAGPGVEVDVIDPQRDIDRGPALDDAYHRAAATGLPAGPDPVVADQASSLA